MSRYRIPVKDTVKDAEKISVHVGWDNPLQTFFATVLMPDPNDEDKDLILLSRGVYPDEITTVSEIATLISPWADMPPATTRRMEQDKAERTPPTSFQKMISDRLRSAEKN